MVNWDGINVKEEHWFMQCLWVLRGKGTVVMIRPVKMSGCRTIKVMKEANDKVILGNCQLKT